MVKNKHNLIKYLHILLTVVFIFVLVLSQNAFGQSIPLSNEDSNYKFELGEKSASIDNNDHIENKNEEFAYGIIERSDVLVITSCVLIVAVEILIVLKNKNNKII
nr:hypothetical protein [Sedimentibacter sp.]